VLAEENKIQKGGENKEETVMLYKVSEMFENDEHLNKTDKRGKTALHYASENGNSEVVQVLLTADEIDVNIADELDKTPLHYAYDKGDVVAIEELHVAGANEDVVDINGNAPVYYSIIYHNEVINKILSHGDAINAPPHN